MDKRRLSKSSTPGKTIDLDPLPEHDLQLERRAVRKLDYTILPIVTLLFLASFIDRNNIGNKHSVSKKDTGLSQYTGNARVAGLQNDLRLTDKQYEICVTVFFGPYIATELGGSLLVKKIGPRFFLPTLVISWGVICIFQGFVKTYAGLLTVRAFLGLIEGPLVPGVILLLSSFYTRKELALRIAIFLSSSSLSGAFSGLLSAAIVNMHGIGGRPGWAWIFILEGLFTVLVGITGFILVPSTPRDSKFLTEYQKELIIRRLEIDRPSTTSAVKFNLKQVMRSFGSLHVIMVIIMSFMGGSMLYGLAFFLPSMVKQLGFSPNVTQLLSAGPFAAGYIVSLTSAFFSDRYASRGIAIILVAILAVTGFALFLSAEHKYTSYGALYLMTAGPYAASPILSAWMANNSEPHYRHATSVALGVLAINCGGIFSTWSFPSKDGPKFRNTTIINLTFSVIIIVGSLINIAYLTWRNKVKKRPGVRAKLLEKYATLEKGKDDGGLSAWIELGDRHPDFVYTL